jgi:autoinducer 2-degrading protein
MSKPFSIIVEAEIKADRMDEFMTMIKTNAEESRKESGCIRFDVLRDQGNANKFWFYEVYENPAAVDFHKTQAHYKAWADFKESGGTVTSVSNKADGEFIG